MIDLDYSNGWGKTPDIVIKCRAENHEIKKEEIGKCLNKYTCEKCGYFYKVDSSG